jgi:hypothetical protein
MRKIKLEENGIVSALKHLKQHEKAPGGSIIPTSPWYRPFMALKLSESHSIAQSRKFKVNRTDENGTIPTRQEVQVNDTRVDALMLQLVPDPISMGMGFGGG